MSFSFEFYAENPIEAADIVTHDVHAPPAVTKFIYQALSGCDDGPVHVKADGHLFEDGSYNVSTCSIRVCPIHWRRRQPIVKKNGA